MPIQTYSLRTELLSDVCDLMEQLLYAEPVAGASTVITHVERVLPGTRSDDPFGTHLKIELTSPHQLEVIRKLIDHANGGEVMRQTLRACPLAENTLERDFNIK